MSARETTPAARISSNDPDLDLLVAWVFNNKMARTLKDARRLVMRAVRKQESNARKMARAALKASADTTTKGAGHE